MRVVSRKEVGWHSGLRRTQTGNPERSGCEAWYHCPRSGAGDRHSATAGMQGRRKARESDSREKGAEIRLEGGEVARAILSHDRTQPAITRADLVGEKRMFSQLPGVVPLESSWRPPNSVPIAFHKSFSTLTRVIASCPAKPRRYLSSSRRTSGLPNDPGLLENR